MFDQDITDTLRIANAYMDDKKMALQALMKDCEKIVNENDKLMSIQSENVAIHREVTKKLDNELQSMIVNRNELDHQLRESKLQNRLDREEFEGLLKAANQRSYSNPKDDEMAVTGRQLANSKQLPGHDHVHTIMSKVKHRMSEIYHHP